MKQEIAEKLKASGLFKKCCTISYSVCLGCGGINDDQFNGPDNPSTCRKCGGEIEFKQNPLPSADQSEAILAAMGLQVVWSESHNDYTEELFDGKWVIVPKLQYLDKLYSLPNKPVFLKDIPKGQRTLANNAALAWLCDNKPDELKTTIEEVRK